MAFDGLLMGGEKASAVSAAPANTSKEAIVVFCNISALKISWISSCRTMRRRKIVDDAENADTHDDRTIIRIAIRYCRYESMCFTRQKRRRSWSSNRTIRRVIHRRDSRMSLKVMRCRCIDGGGASLLQPLAL